MTETNLSLFLIFWMCLLWGCLMLDRLGRQSTLPTWVSAFITAMVMMISLGWFLDDIDAAWSFLYSTVIFSSVAALWFGITAPQ